MKRPRTHEEKALAERSWLLRAWKRWHREERDAALAGPHGLMLAELLRIFANLKHVKPAQLIGFVRSIDWASVDAATKLVVIHEFNVAITAIREKNGLPPIDDGLPGEPDTPFRIVRAIVLTASPPDEGAHRGEARPA